MNDGSVTGCGGLLSRSSLLLCRGGLPLSLLLSRRRGRLYFSGLLLCGNLRLCRGGHHSSSTFDCRRFEKSVQRKWVAGGQPNVVETLDRKAGGGDGQSVSSAD